MTKETPKFSIITVTHNNRLCIATMLDSVLHQQCSVPFEVIVVDNGSTDGTADFVEREYPWVNLIRSTNTGFGLGNNLAAQHAKGELLAFINPDTELDARCIEALLNPLREEKLVTTAKVLLQRDRTTINTCGNKIHFTAYGFVNGYGDPSDTHLSTETVDGISGAAFGICRTQFLRLGGFDTSFFLYCEDTEFSLRCRRDGMKIILVPGSIVYHDYEMEFSPKKIYYLEYGRWSILKKYYSAKDWALLWPSLLIADMLSSAFALNFGAGGLKMKWKGTMDALKNPVTPFSTHSEERVVVCSREFMPFSTISHNPVVLLIGRIINMFFSLNFKIYKLTS